MWFPFWRPRNRFSVDELRYLTEQLQKVQSVNELNQDFVIEALRSIAELITYGDQHDPSFFEFFMEKQIMGEFVRILKISRPAKVALQLLQTMSIMIQNLRNEHAIYYMFSNEHINFLISYSYDFHNDELLSYYISFLRAISGKLNKNTTPLLVKTQNDEVVSFPLYAEAVKFAFHDESMVRIAVRALTLNVYHVGDEGVNKYVSSIPLSDYFPNLVKYFQMQCISLEDRVSKNTVNPDSQDAISSILTTIDEIEDNLYYFSDIISAGVPDLGRLITDNILQLLVFPLLLPSLRKQKTGTKISVTTSLYLLCCVLRIVKTKELASSIAAALFFAPEVFLPKLETTPNGSILKHQVSPEQGQEVEEPSSPCHSFTESKQRQGSCSSCFTDLPKNTNDLHVSLRRTLLSFVVSGNDVQALGALCFLSTLLQTKELDESMLDGLGILPQRKQHKRLLLQALVGEESGEEQLFSPRNNRESDKIDTELDIYLQKIKDQHVLSYLLEEPLTSPHKHRYEVLDALVCLFCRCNISAETLWTGGWLLKQLLPHGEQEFTLGHLQKLKDSHRDSSVNLLVEAKGTWCDMLLTVLKHEWRNCKRAIEASSPHKDPNSILMPPRTFSSGGESSFADGERMSEMIKVFVLQRQLLIFSSGGFLAEQPPLNPPMNSPVDYNAKTDYLDVFPPKPGSEINSESALPCRIAFERGKERHFSFLAISKGMSGWIILLEELPLDQHRGVVRVSAPLAGSDPRIDEKHPKWLNLRIRPSNLPVLDSKHNPLSRPKTKVLVDGRWTLAFRDDQDCNSAKSMVTKELHLLQNQVAETLKPLFDDHTMIFSSKPLHKSSDGLLEEQPLNTG
ncbi:uncharacterized protein LOC110024604 [Phalaenopsis equestris]|uniref:uncharacterized protein LOC110024604 n=1 Tax=Phalaenopsis equestris TaxID=78828 RepID=UPI0009E52B6E|nr:uncharacterized protein LOC110024604 [Phalaenopsis equestris]